MTYVGSTSPTSVLYTMRNYPMQAVMDFKRDATQNCPDKCECKLTGIYSMSRPQMNILCQGRNLTKIPEVIPQGASNCNFSYNFITDLSPLYDNPHYENVPMIILSYNYVSHLDPVKFPEMLHRKKDSMIQLNNNMLTHFPAKKVKRIYDNWNMKNRFRPQISLGLNPFVCSCDYVKDFQDFLTQYKFEIPDIKRVRCDPNDPYNPDILITAIDVENLCSSKAKLGIINIFSIIFAIIIVLLIMDCVYHSWKYKKTQKLPIWVRGCKF